MSNATKLTCPSGGQWYACGAESSKFVGCCTSDPCSNGCVQGNVRSGGFPMADFGKFPDASCETGSNFFSCSAAPTFWGCCKSNPCTDKPSCKEGDLVPAFLGRPEQFAAYAPSASPSPTSTPSSAPSNASSSSSNNGAVIGGAVGGSLGAAILVGFIVFFLCRRRKRKQQVAHDEAGAASTPKMRQRFEDNTSAQFVGQSPPPTYSSPNSQFYQPIPPPKDSSNRRSYQAYRQEADGLQELPANTTPPAGHRTSELPGEAVSYRPHGISELPSSTTRVIAELETPQTSPDIQQGEFNNDLATPTNQTSDMAPGSAL
ncbi:hypothetical protein HBI56_002550 [Parastagonospora nodorum]|nr:hypothetical protein HBH56_138500 [Parastagonospora nodorum]KAH3928140.1 hypothetical protein HBH54_143640 [Parastagonospora nodorum]KAH3949032.1 hypothetical protein HBH53_093640 [Parastagonospora nodorum]KAH3972314.1 hypothetical protein HBH52_151580 [Parastagonospora nodorum]KAH3983490.1 hypothetical protein HBH51_034490 [Parastagonospora nodorum]